MESQSGRSRALDSQDVLGRIFEHLTFSSRSGVDQEIRARQSLLWVALTCKAFSSPALDVLWYSMNSLIPLLKLLDPFEMRNNTYVLRGTIQDSDWDRYDRYARRVREFTYSAAGGDQKLAPHTRVRIAQLWSKPLLPSLRRFTCPEIQSSGLFIHLLFISPTLEHVELNLISELDNEAIGTFLSALADGVPDLKHLTLSGWLSNQSLLYIPQLKNLKSLELARLSPSISSELLHQLSTLEYLSNLAIDISSSLLRLESPGAFPQLRRLEVVAPFAVMRDFFADIQAPSLEALDLIAPLGPFPQGWAGDCKSVLDLVSSRWGGLRSISLDHSGEWEHETLPIDTLLPLLQLPYVESFQIKGFFLTASDATIRQYASAWPALQTLVFPFDISGSPADASVSTLLGVANLCPNLRYLQVPLNVDNTPDLPASRPPSHRLDTLSIATYNGPLEFRQLLLLARHIDRLFPNLQLLKHAAENDSYIWHTVCTMVKTFQGIRFDQLDPHHNPL